MRELGDDPHPLLARLRAHEPVTRLAALNGWLITRYDLAVRVLRDPTTFTVDDPRFSTSRVVGSSMLSRDGAAHARHREAFASWFYPARVRGRFARFIETQTDGLISTIRPAGAAELRRQFAGPLAVAVVTEVLGLHGVDTDAVLAWYAAIVAAVSEATGGGPVSASGRRAFGRLRSAVLRVLDDPQSLLARAARGPDGLSPDEVASNAAVLMFGGVDTTEGMILNTVRHLLGDREALTAVRDRRDLLPNAIEESLRLEPAVASVDRYATRDVELADAHIQRGDLVVVSLAGANRDPAVFADPDRFDVYRANARLNVAFAHGSHYCLGARLARTETAIAIARLLDRLPGLHLDPRHPIAPRGLVFRKPPVLQVCWTAAH
ncbi:cytochrome P450 [Mycobacterium heckeshornense]|uniref:cytochrome P450 n=1 Tax=Mycobacterium heckeshornense TaxID=110505 RepID=UPI0006629BD9|nr:cytochrome P450 [Mycobacterium heckeshornense]KMV22971.1 cytochrome P450 [Mycobacterium heckeshornense]MCV7036162.1 cytochrome P450 [Mycobacterium heckeshornense]PIJ35642.1 cytochrome P450 [Mycobacterium heckeshornense]